MLNYKAFTLIEIVIVMAIIGIIVSTTSSVSYKIVKRFQTQFEVSRCVKFINSVKRESLLYSIEEKIFSQEGVLRTSSNKSFKIDGCLISTNNEITFSPQGTSGGEINIQCGEFSYMIIIKPPFGEVEIL